LWEEEEEGGGTLLYYLTLIAEEDEKISKHEGNRIEQPKGTTSVFGVLPRKLITRATGERRVLSPNPGRWGCYLSSWLAIPCRGVTCLGLTGWESQIGQGPEV
jgi:hypothetical protein